MMVGIWQYLPAAALQEYTVALVDISIPAPLLLGDPNFYQK